MKKGCSKNFWNTAAVISATFGVSTLSLTGCLNNAPATSSNSKLAVTSGSDFVYVSPTPTATPSATPTPTASATPRSSSPANSFRVEAIGYNAATVTVTARSILKIRFTPGVQDQFVAGSSFAPAYSQLGVYISAGSTAAMGAAKPTPMLSNGLFRAKTNSGIVDYSANIPKTCAATDGACRETVVIKVDKPNNDYWCMNYGAYCNWTQVYETHPWNGTLEVESDDTAALQ